MTHPFNYQTKPNLIYNKVIIAEIINRSTVHQLKGTVHTRCSKGDDTNMIQVMKRGSAFSLPDLKNPEKNIRISEKKSQKIVK